MTLSDHHFIVFDVALCPLENTVLLYSSSPLRRWSLRLHWDTLEAAAIVAADPEEEAAWFKAIMTSIFKASMARTMF